MMMQHRRGDFDGQVSIEGLLKLDKIADEQRIRISNLAMASRRIIADYPDSCSWFCLSVRTGSEFTVEKYLYEENVEALVPACLAAPRYVRGRMMAPQKRPVMPGYVLVQCAASAHAILALIRVKHVTGIIGGAVSPYRIPLTNIIKFREEAKTNRYDYRPPDPTEYVVNEPIRVADGPFASFPGTVIDWDGEKNRVKVEVMIFGRATSVELDVAQIEKV